MSNNLDPGETTVAIGRIRVNTFVSSHMPTYDIHNLYIVAILTYDCYETFVSVQTKLNFDFSKKEVKSLR